MIFLNGMVQRPGAPYQGMNHYDYTISDSTITFTLALGNDVVMATYLRV